MTDWSDLVRGHLARLDQGAPDESLVEELAAHLAQAFEEACDEGASQDEARRRALRILEARDLFRATMAVKPPERTGGWMTPTNLIGDIKFALRMLVRAPGYSVIAILTFAVGIGINTAVFNVVNGVLLRPLPYPEAERITLLWMDNRREGIREDITSWPNYIDWRTQSTSYEHMGAFLPTPFTLTGAGEAERLIGASVTANFFDVMRVPPMLGRVFTSENETAGADQVVVLSYGLWQRRFGGSADVIGQTITLSGRPYEVIGVMPPALQWPQRAELWSPLAPSDQLRQSRGSFWLPVIGRLKAGVTVQAAQTEMSGIADRLEQEYPGNRGFGVNVVPLAQQLVGHVERPLLILLTAVAFVLLIASANLANLTLGRTAARRKELAIRTALGASRKRVVTQIITESLVLAMIGAVVGTMLAFGATRAFLALGGTTIPRQDAIVMDARVLLFALGIATLAAVLSALAPALQASRRKVVDHLREGARAGASAGSRRTRTSLVVAEIALALVLLTGAGLLMRTFWSMQQVERGFNPRNVAMATLSVGATSYRTADDVRAFFTRVLERVRALPGVQSAATGTGVLQPLVTRSGIFSIEGQPLPPPEERVEYPIEVVSPGYFETVGMTIVRGRGFSDADHATAPRAVVVNETLARMAWPDADPIGKRITPGNASGMDGEVPWFTVIGVIRDAHRNDVTRSIRPEVYFSSLQQTPRTQTIFVRTAGDPEALISSVRREVQAIDPQLPLFAVTTLERELSLTLSQPRFQAVLLMLFAGIALLLAAIGIYGVTSHAVSQRTQEVGIRMAMGAARRDVMRMMLLQHLRPACLGLLVGIVGAFALSRFLQSLLFGVSATDPVTFGLTALVLLLVAAIACFVPARRATRVDPLVALRTE